MDMTPEQFVKSLVSDVIMTLAELRRYTVIEGEEMPGCGYCIAKMNIFISDKNMVLYTGTRFFIVQYERLCHGTIKYDIRILT